MFSQNQIDEFNRYVRDWSEIAQWYHSEFWMVLVGLMFICSLVGVYKYFKKRTSPVYYLVVLPVVLPVLIYVAVPFAIGAILVVALTNLGKSPSAQNQLHYEMHGYYK